MGAVIVHHGDPAFTRRAVTSARASRGVELLLVVVDHGPGPPEGLSACVREAGGFHVRPPANLGFAAGLNRGVAEVRARGGADLLLFLNHDLELEPDAALRLADRFEEEPALGVAGPVLTYRDRPDVVWNAGSGILWPSGRPRSLHHGRPLAEVPREPYPAEFICGCAVMVRAGVLDRIGPLCEDYFLYFEDADLCSRARAAGYRIEVEPRARARHHPGSAVGSLPSLGAFCRARNRLHFSRRWAPAGLGPRLARLRFALGRILRGGADRRGALDGLRGAMGRPPPDLLGEEEPWFRESG